MRSSRRSTKLWDGGEDMGWEIEREERILVIEYRI
jgi:hypothetical protein